MDVEMLFGLALIIGVGLFAMRQIKKNNDKYGPGN